MIFTQSPAFVGRVAVSPHPSLEVDVSAHSDYYNVYTIEGLDVDKMRSLTILALDGEFWWNRFELLGEYAHVSIDIPDQLVGSC